VIAAVVCTLVIAAVSTIGDYLWANVVPHHRPIYGLAHGALLFMAVGGCLGATVRKPITGALGVAAIGFGAAGLFYLLQPFLGYTAILVLFGALWVAIGVLNGRVLRRGEPIGTILLRSALAAIGAGVGFYAISGIWFPFNPREWDYLQHFWKWAIAYFPAFAALLVGQSKNR
jgi:hypothetical protein